MISATIDTSALVPMVRRAQTPEPQLSPIWRAWQRGDFELVLSRPILDELSRTLASPQFARWLSDRDVRIVLAGLQRFAVMTELTVRVTGVATHPEDDLILATALSGKVDYLVTLDRQLLRLGEYGGVRIVSPQAFLAVLEAEA